ncbi:MAG: hypothetical protein K6B41_15490 [Butyrivibrio sp.]|nr:hypothetical protein [Butyrivibrio sp.]
MFKIQYLYKELDLLRQELISVSNNLQNSPEGYLKCCGTKNFHQYYQVIQNPTSKEKKIIYLKKSQNQLITDLAKKRYYIYRKNELVRDIKALDKLLSKKLTYRSEKLLDSNPLISNIILPELNSLSISDKSWVSQPYPKNPNFPEHLTVLTPTGEYVRSKSEAYIAKRLLETGIPYRYECELILEQFTIYPDFTVRRPQDRKIFYFEHFGKMDDPDYQKKVKWKLDLYARNGILPFYNLICTYEDKDHPLDFQDVDKLIKAFLS